jgi:hypothetical protein
MCLGLKVLVVVLLNDDRGGGSLGGKVVMVGLLLLGFFLRLLVNTGFISLNSLNFGTLQCGNIIS